MSALASEAIEIIREGHASARNPVLLYSIGKDSSVLLHLVRKAFFPGPVPFPLLHIDTGWKFREMYEHRARVTASLGLSLIVHRNESGIQQGIDPFSHDPDYYTAVMKTQALRQALDAHQFDMAFGGARRDEEKSRSKERVFSVRSAGHGWDPRNQRPEFWNLYNARIRPGETIRVFPLSNWTETDIWQYINEESVPLVPLYFAAVRPVVRRRGQWIMVDDDRFPLASGESPEFRRVRFRTLGCYPLSAAIESDCETAEAIVAETALCRQSERAGRFIDDSRYASMELKKRDGYF